MTKDVINVGLIDDHRALTDAMILLLSKEENIEVVAIAHDFDAGKSLLDQGNIDVVIIDMNLGNEDGTDLVSLGKDNDIKVLVLSAYCDLALIKRAMRSGASGYIAKSSAAKHIQRGINRIYQGKKYFDDTIQEQINSFITQEPIPIVKERPMLNTLSVREKEVLKLVKIGLTSKEIANELHLSKHTIDGYRKKLKTLQYL